MKVFAKFALLVLIIPALVYALPVSFCLKNSTQRSLGVVTLHYIGGQTTMSVTGQGNWITDVPSTVGGVTINGQRSNYPASKEITLPSGARVHLSWKSTNLIEVIDIATQG